MRGTLWKLLKVMVFKWILIKKLIICESVFCLKFSQEFGLHQDCQTEPVIAKSKPVTAKPQKDWCQCNKAINYSTRMIVVYVEPTEPYGESLSEVDQSLVDQ